MSSGLGVNDETYLRGQISLFLLFVLTKKRASAGARWYRIKTLCQSREKQRRKGEDEMELVLSFVLFAIGIALVVKGGDVFVDAASWIAKAFGIPTFIIGATIVSIATTMPEMIVSMIAAGQGKVDMAIGNAVGSVTANTGLILATAMIFMTIVIERKDYAIQCGLLVLAAALLPISSISLSKFTSAEDGALPVWASIVLFIIFFAFMAVNVKKAKAETGTAAEKVAIEKKDLIINILKFVLGAAAIVLGSQLMVNSGSDIATFFGVPERVIALTLVAIGTSLPELVTTITAIVKKETSLSIGNIVGANLIDLALILPLCSIVSGKELPIPASSRLVDMPVCLGIIALALIPLFIRKKASKIQGVIMAVAYCVYIVMVV